MTSSSIVFTLFVFGALTYMAVKHGTESESDRARAMLTNRLLREHQANGTELENELSFMESDGQGMPNEQNGMSTQEDLNNMQDARYLSSNEWIS